jgi:pimeloyl-ACP methyl ester carboxylesterase
MLAHDVQGAGPPLLLVHGVTLDRRMWEPNMAALTRRFRVVRCDLAGFGATPPPTGPHTHAEDLRALLAELGIERAAVVGLSMGGGVALELTLGHPDVVSALVLADTDLPGVPLSPDLREIIAAAAGHARAGELDAARAAWLASPFFAHSPPAVTAALEKIVGEYSFWHWRNPNLHQPLELPAAFRGGEVRAPALVVRGEHEVAHFVAHSERIAADIPGARSVVIEGAGHMSNMDRPSDFDRVVLDFLAALG